MSFSSADTSLKQVPALFKKINWGFRNVNLDIGGGKFDIATKYLWDNFQVVNKVYDPYNRSENENQKALDWIFQYHTVTCANVLNVIPDRGDRSRVYALAATNKDIMAYFWVYEGNKSGVGKGTKKDCWQNNQRTEFYVDEVRVFFKNVKRKGQMIIAFN